MDDLDDDTWGDLELPSEEAEAMGKAIKHGESRKHFTAILIDSRRNMLENNAPADASSHLQRALTTAQWAIQQSCISDPTRKFAILLMGTEGGNAGADFPNLYWIRPEAAAASSSSSSAAAAAAVSTAEFFEPGPLVVTKLMTLSSSLPGSLERDKGIRGLRAAGSKLPVDKALWATSNAFAKAGAKFTDKKEVWIITNDDAPNVDTRAAITRAGDCADSGEAIVVWPFLRGGGDADTATFNREGFWREVTAIGDDDAGLMGAGMDAGSSAASGWGRVVEARGAAAGDDDGASSSSSAAGSSASTATSTRRMLVGSAVGVRAATLTDWRDELLANVKTRAMQKRVYARIGLLLTDGVALAVGVYNTLYPAKKPTPIKIYAEQPSLTVKTKSKYLVEATGEALENHTMMRYLPFGESLVLFTGNEAKDMRVAGGDAAKAAAAAATGGASSSSSSAASVAGGAAGGGPAIEGKGLTLLGFKPASAVKMIDNLKPPVFLYPLDADLEGSSHVFRALWEKMLDRDVAAICRYEPRRAASPKFVALFAAREAKTDTGRVVAAPGMYAVTLPFADDMRNLTLKDTLPVAAAPAKVAAAKKLVTALTLPMPALDPVAANPALQKFWTTLESFALTTATEVAAGAAVAAAGGAGTLADFELAQKQAESRWNPEDDTSKPDADGMKELAGAELAEVRETLELDAAAAATSSTTKKRATSGSTAGVKRKAPAKAARAAGGGGDGDEDEGEEAQPDAGIDWAGHVAAGTVNTRAITLDMMKAYCRRNGLQVGGTKAVLAERITNHFASAAAGGGGGGEPPAKRRRKE